jgi:mono/diheme cytochrome c family protein
MGIVFPLLLAVGSAFAADNTPRIKATNTGQSLYERHCAGCHGPEGAGDGPGVRYIYPLPRNLRHDRYNLVRNRSRIASREDITRVLREGMPGTAMKPFRDVLEKAELQAIVDEVLRLRTEGAKDNYLELCRKSSESPNETEGRAFVEQQTTPASPPTAPEFGSGGRAAVARGKQLFRQQGCPSCHGIEGAGSPDVMLKDQAGTALRPRDLVREPFKGGHDDESVYYRIRFGFPGGPMPEHPSLTDEEAVDLVAYVQSLAREPKRQLRTYEMRRYATRGLYISEFGSKNSEP